jgi:hypothetical protein
MIIVNFIGRDDLRGGGVDVLNTVMSDGPRFIGPPSVFRQTREWWT